jgi:hypothetical protein
MMFAQHPLLGQQQQMWQRCPFGKSLWQQSLPTCGAKAGGSGHVAGSSFVELISVSIIMTFFFFEL